MRLVYDENLSKINDPISFATEIALQCTCFRSLETRVSFPASRQYYPQITNIGIDFHRISPKFCLWVGKKHFSSRSTSMNPAPGDHRI